MTSEPAVPTLSVPALYELRRIYCKHLHEVFTSSETIELVERGCLAGQASPDQRTFIVHSVTPLGVAALEARERR